jgi:flagellar protein FlaG
MKMATEMMSGVSPLGARPVEGLHRMDRPQSVAPETSVQRSVSEKKAEKPEEEEKKTLDVESLRQLVEQANQSMEVKSRRLLFSVYEETGSQMVQVFDRDTDKLIRQFPPEEVLGVVKQIQDMSAEELTGLMLKEQA